MIKNTKIVFVTGATRGIGAAIADLFANNGYQVVGTSRTKDGVKTITERLASAPVPGIGIDLDMQAHDSFDEKLKAVTQQFGSIDILINNAAMVADNLFMRMKPYQWQNVIDTNLNAAFYLMKACVRPMVKQRWGRIINLSSVVAMTGNLGQANYCAAKAGLMAMSKSVALEVARYGVTINCIAPGYIETDMTKAFTDNAKESILAAIPMGRIGQVDDIAASVYFFASESANYITGSVIHINGGMLML